MQVQKVNLTRLPQQTKHLIKFELKEATGETPKQLQLSEEDQELLTIKEKLSQIDQRSVHVRMRQS